jgi:hypothetical protein
LRSPLQAHDHVLLALDLAVTEPGRDVAPELPIDGLLLVIGADEALEREAFV